MSYTVRDASNDLLGYLQPAQRTYPPTATEDDPLPQVLKALNGAAAKLAILGDNWCVYDTRAERIRVPATITVSGSWSAGASSVTLSVAPDAYMLGCVVRFGSMPHNVIEAISGSTITLRHPMLTAGSGTGIVYHSCINPASDVMKVLGPVCIADGPELQPAHHPTAFNAVGYSPDYGRSLQSYDYRRAMGNSIEYYARSNGEPLIEAQPRVYWVDQVWKTAGVVPAKRIYLAPMPQDAQIIEYRVKKSPTKWVTADLYDAGSPNTDPSTALPYEDERVVSVFLPVARFLFAAMPVMADSKARAQIVEDYKAALATENTLTPLQDGLNSDINPEW